ncbi:hypothetical protein EI555_012884 [Monodon monoceros]|uniref:Cytochrome c oxidase subunit 3 n=1 Tax=Monodon monoceros TaxID=40151 RepID=A0A4U1F9P4_MONMO|nr:hypothetical protein EI555_012884 [Monodon monoceros]
MLGLYFTLLQASEYYEAPFTISDGIYGSTFFVATGFHGLHVIIGSTFLIICFIRQIKFHFTSSHHFALTILNSHFTLASMIPIILLVFAAREAAIGLALLVIISNTYGTDYPQLLPNVLLRPPLHTTPNPNNITPSLDTNSKPIPPSQRTTRLKKALHYSTDYITNTPNYNIHRHRTNPILHRNRTERLNAGLYFLFYTLIGSINMPTKYNRISKFSITTTLNPTAIHFLIQHPHITSLTYGLPFPHAFLVRNNQNQLYLFTSNRPKVTHRILFSQPDSTRYRSHPYPTPLKLHRSYRSNNRPWPHSLYTLLPGKLELSTNP